MDDGIQVLDTDVPVEDTPVVDDTTYTPYEPINFENGTLVTPGSYNSETGELTMPVYSGKAPVNATNLNHIEQGLKNLENHVLENSVLVEDSLESDSTTNAPSIHAVTNIIESRLDMANTRVGDLTVNKLRVQNKLAILDFEAYATNFQHGYNLVGKIPSEFLPKASGYFADALLYFPIFLSGMNLAAYGRVTSDGSVEIYSDTNSSDLRVGYVPTTGQIRIHTNWFVE